MRAGFCKNLFVDEAEHLMRNSGNAKVHFANINIRNLTGERIVSADDGPHWFDDTPSLSDGR